MQVFILGFLWSRWSSKRIWEVAAISQHQLLSSPCCASLQSLSDAWFLFPTFLVLPLENLKILKPEQLSSSQWPRLHCGQTAGGLPSAPSLRHAKLVLAWRTFKGLERCPRDELIVLSYREIPFIIHLVNTRELCFFLGILLAFRSLWQWKPGIPGCTWAHVLLWTGHPPGYWGCPALLEGSSRAWKCLRSRESRGVLL